MGDAADDAIDQAMGLTRWDEGGCEPPRAVNWHKRQSNREPKCRANQWRTGDREVVVNIRDMTDQHLRNAIQYAKGRPQHRTKLDALVEEQVRRDSER